MIDFFEKIINFVNKKDENGICGVEKCQILPT